VTFFNFGKDSTRKGDVHKEGNHKAEYKTADGRHRNDADEFSIDSSDPEKGNHGKDGCGLARKGRQSIGLHRLDGCPAKGQMLAEYALVHPLHH